MRALAGVDNNDLALSESASTSDATIEIIGRPPFNIDDYHTKHFPHVGAMTTHHTLSNVRVDHVPGTKVASLTANGLNQHFRKGEGVEPGAKNLLAGVRYAIDLVKEEGEEGLWRMQKWAMEVVWREGILV